MHLLLTHGLYKNTITKQLAGNGSLVSLVVRGYRWHRLPFGKSGWLLLSCCRLPGKKYSLCFPSLAGLWCKERGAMRTADPGDPMRLGEVTLVLHS